MRDLLKRNDLDLGDLLVIACVITLVYGIIF